MPKLELKKRSENPVVEQPTLSSDAKSSPFGGARPIDTDQKLKEIEEKRAAAAAEKKAREEKLKEERKASRAAAAAEKKGGKAEHEGDTTAGGRSLDILRRAS